MDRRANRNSNINRNTGKKRNTGKSYKGKPVKKRPVPVKKKKKKLNKKRFLLVAVCLFLFIFLIFKGVTAIKNRISPPKPPKSTYTQKTEQQLKAENEKKITVVIDAAKGGKETGKTTADNQSEKDICLDIAKQVAGSLQKENDVNVYLTRDTDIYMSARERAKYAIDKKADLFVSIRLNAQNGSTEANGLDIYYSGPVLKKSVTPDEDTDENTDGQNGGNAKSKGDTSDTKTKDVKNTDSSKTESTDKTDGTVGTDETGDAQSKADVDKDRIEAEKKAAKIVSGVSKDFASTVEDTMLSYVKIRDRGIFDGNFDVLKYTPMPSIVIQCGFITNPSDAEKLASPSMRTEFADGISQGILQFVDKNSKELLKDRTYYR